MTLPDKGTLKNIYNQKDNYAALSSLSDWFWSSSVSNNDRAWDVRFGYGGEVTDAKTQPLRVICVEN